MLHIFHSIWCGAAPMVKLIYWLIELNERQEIIISYFDDVINWLRNYIWFSEMRVVYALCNVNLLNKINFILDSTGMRANVCVSMWFDHVLYDSELILIMREMPCDSFNCLQIYYANRVFLGPQNFSFFENPSNQWILFDWLSMIELWISWRWNSFSYKIWNRSRY